MANRYGEAALIAARQGATTKGTPVMHWENALLQLYPTSPIARMKGGPRGAFLGLCEAGLVKGIPAGEYDAPPQTKAYAEQAVALLIAAAQHWSTSALWQAVTNDPKKIHGGQMDVVMALWKNDLIVRTP